MKNNLLLAYNEYTVSAQEATQKMKGFGAELKSIRSRYSDIVWWILKLFNK
jgi:hypothetical protein